MVTGIHFIPLRKPGGDPVSHIGIFVKIKLNHVQSSDDGLCQQNTEAHISPSDPSDTQQTNKSLADRNATETSDNQTTDCTNSVSSNGVHLCQQASTVTVDVHCDNIEY